MAHLTTQQYSVTGAAILAGRYAAAILLGAIAFEDVIASGSLATQAAAAPSTLTVSGANNAQAGSQAFVVLTLDKPASSNLTASIATSAGATAPTSATFQVGQTTAIVPMSATAAVHTVSVSNAAGLAVIGSPKQVVFSPPGPVPATPVTYRSYSPYLFQAVPQKQISPQIAGSTAAYSLDTVGPTGVYICHQTGWKWKTQDGDWLDANYVWQGPTPYATFQSPMGVAGTVQTATADMLTFIKQVQLEERYCATKLRTLGAPRFLCTPLHSDPSKVPYIDVTYSDGSTQRLMARVVASVNASSLLPQTTNESQQLPVFVEYDKPKNITTNLFPTAALGTFFLTGTEFSGNPTLEVQGILVPPLNEQPDTSYSGAAWKAGVGDAGIDQLPGVLGSHDYADSRPFSDFFVSTTASDASEFNYDPRIWNSSLPPDTTKWPHTVQGKWLLKAGLGVTPTLLRSADLTAMGISPIAPGLGAYRLYHPGTPLAPGAVTDNLGTILSSMKIMFPEALFGQGVEDLYVRYYEYNNSTYEPTLADQPQVMSAGAPDWVSLSGKTGIMGSHQNSYGGASGASGGRDGWQMRHTWVQPVCGGLDGPLKGAEVRGWHLDDYRTNNPPGYNYGVDKTFQFERFGREGGLGSAMYPKRWYCVENRIRLNTIDKNAGTWQADGILESWLDGVLVYRETGMVFRTGVANTYAYSPSLLRPARDMTPTCLWGNDFHGARTPLTIPRDIIRAGLVWGTTRIGAMRRVALPTWIPTAGSSVTITGVGSVMTNSFASQVPAGYDQYWSSAIIKAYSGAQSNWDIGTHGGLVYYGAGHSGSNNNATLALLFKGNTLEWTTLNGPTSWLGVGAAAGANDTNAAAQDAAHMDQDYGDALIAVDGQRRPGARHSYAMDGIQPAKYTGVSGGVMFSVFPPGVGFSAYNAAGKAVVGASLLPMHSTTNPAANVWRRAGSDLSLVPLNTALTNTTLQAFVPQGRRTFWHSNGAPNALRWWDHYRARHVTGTGPSLLAGTRNYNSGLLLPIPERGLLLGMRETSANLGVLTVSWLDTTQANPQVGGTAVFSTPIYINTATSVWSHAWWVPQTQKLYVVKALLGPAGALDTNGLYEVSIPAVLTNPWPVTRIALSAGAMTFSPFEGDWQTFRYLPEARVAAFVDYDKNAGPTGTTSITAIRPPNL